MKNKDIIIFSAIDWDTQWQWQQELAVHFAKKNRVLFIENTGVRSLKIKDSKRIINRLKKFFYKSNNGFKKINENLTIFSPLFIPFPFNKFSQIINKNFINSYLNSWINFNKFRSNFIFSFLPTPLIDLISNDLKAENRIYLATDNQSYSSSKAKNLFKYEKLFAEKSDITFYSSSIIRENLKNSSKKMFYFPGGVNYEKFSKFHNYKKKEKILYIGEVKNIIDFELLDKIIKKFYYVKFDFIGPISTNIQSILKYKNVKFYGKVNHDFLVKKMSEYKVGIIPYKKNKFTDGIYPAKLNEYLASGAAVVSTNINEIKEFAKVNSNTIKIAKNHNEFISKLTTSLEEKNREKKYKKIAKKYDWKHLFKNFEKNLLILDKKDNKIKIPSKIPIFTYQFKYLLSIFISAFILIYVSIFVLPLPSLIGKYLIDVDTNIKKVDKAIIFSGTGSINYENVEFYNRFEDAKGLLDSNTVDELVIMQRKHNRIDEGDIIKNLLVSEFGNKFKITVVDKEFPTTYQNVKYMKNYINNDEKLLLITSGYNTKRLKKVFEKLTNNNIKVYKSLNDQSFKIRFFETKEQVHFILREFVALIYYKLKGWI